MWYLLEVMLEHLQILYVALCNGDKDLRKRYVARLYRMVSVRCLTVAWHQKAGACLRGQWNPGIRVVCKLVLEEITSANLWRNTLVHNSKA